ncbi:hypothetical protein LCGC14_2463650 [marine sediment metagenome]|uniref:Uncharacterized protein n=1 Tax=marine sediment metagenome TaxID=412755 RepID=A0A0F9C086_9ZZZZ
MNGDMSKGTRITIYFIWIIGAILMGVGLGVLLI